MNGAVLKSFVLVLVFFTLISCKRNQGPPTDPVTGNPNEIVVVIGKEMWKGQTGYVIRKVLSQPLSCLPESEPVFSVIDVPPDAFINLFKSHRNIITVKISSDFTEPKVEYAHDTWASPQAVVNIQASSTDNFIELLISHHKKIIGYFLNAERDRLRKTYQDSHDKSVVNTLEQEFGIKLYVPVGFKIIKKEPSFVWICHEAYPITQNIFIYTYPYQSDSTLTCTYLVKKRDVITRKNIEGPTNASYMTTESKRPQELNLLTYKGKDAGEMRGLWKMQNNAMHGPFVSLTVLVPGKNKVITVEGNVYAPKTSVREYIRQLEAMIYSLEISDQPDLLLKSKK